jgi:hypothetical protein
MITETQGRSKADYEKPLLVSKWADEPDSVSEIRNASRSGSTHGALSTGRDGGAFSTGSMC